MLLSYFLWEVMRYNIALLHKKVTNCLTKLLFMEMNALQNYVTTSKSN